MMKVEERTNAIDRSGDCVHGTPLARHCQICVWETNGIEERLMPDLQAENDQLRQQHDALLEALEGLFIDHEFLGIYADGRGYYCSYCQAMNMIYEQVEHHEDCALMKARAAIAAARGEGAK